MLSTIKLMSVLILSIIMSGCVSTQSNQVSFTECDNWSPKLIVSTDSQKERMDKLSYNTKMQAQCQYKEQVIWE